MLTEEQDKELRLTIRFWQGKLDTESYLLEPSTKALIASTLGYLRKLQQLDPRPTTYQVG